MRRRLALPLAVLLLAASARTASGRNPAPERPRARVAVDQLCPEKLPELAPPEDGDGGILQAPVSPALLASSAAWLCHYPLPWTDQDGEEGRRLDGDVIALPAADLARVDELTSSLAPFPAEMACTEELGPVYVLVVDDGRQQTALIVEDYGCRSTVLSDLPLGGEIAVSSEGSVNGTLAGSELAAQLSAWIGS